jgi:hypothetical protein
MLYSPSLRLRRWRAHDTDVEVFYRVKACGVCLHLAYPAGVLQPAPAAVYVA